MAAAAVDVEASEQSNRERFTPEFKARIVNEALEGKEPTAIIAQRVGTQRTTINMWLDEHYLAHPDEQRRHLRLPMGPGPKSRESWLRGETPQERAVKRAAKLERPQQTQPKASAIDRAREVHLERMRTDPAYKRSVVEKRRESMQRRKHDEEAPPPAASTTTMLSRPQPPSRVQPLPQQRSLRYEAVNAEEQVEPPYVRELREVIEKQRREIEILRDTAREALDERKTLRGMVEIMQREAAERQRRLT